MFFTANEHKPWTNYKNNENEYLTIGAVVHVFVGEKIRILWLINANLLGEFSIAILKVAASYMCTCGFNSPHLIMTFSEVNSIFFVLYTL